MIWRPNRRRQQFWDRNAALVAVGEYTGSKGKRRTTGSRWRLSGSNTIVNEVKKDYVEVYRGMGDRGGREVMMRINTGKKV